MKYIKDEKIINATEKAFKVIYKELGYKPYNEPLESAKSEDKQVSNAIVYDDITKSDIAKLLRDKGIDYNKRDNKAKLYDLLLGSD